VLKLHLHCDRKHVAGRCHSHAGCEHNLLTVAMKNAVIWIPGSRQGECNIYLLMGFSAFEKEKEKLVFVHKSIWATITRIRTTCNWLWQCHPESVPLKSSRISINKESKNKVEKTNQTKAQNPQLLVFLISPAPSSWVIRLLSEIKNSLFYKWIHAWSENFIRK